MDDASDKHLNLNRHQSQHSQKTMVKKSTAQESPVLKKVVILANELAICIIHQITSQKGHLDIGREVRGGV